MVINVKRNFFVMFCCNHVPSSNKFYEKSFVNIFMRFSRMYFIFSEYYNLSLTVTQELPRKPARSH